jgi:hypothetical protein
MTHGSSRHRSRIVAVAFACGLAALAAALLATRPGPAGAQGSQTPPRDALQHLEAMNQEIQFVVEYKDDYSTDYEQELLKGAIESKHRFVASAFGECQEKLILDLLVVDIRLEEALEAGAFRRGNMEGIKKAHDSATDVRNHLKDCAGRNRAKLGQKLKDAMEHLETLARVGELGKHRLEDAADATHARKLKIVGGLKIHGCDVERIFFLLDRIDVDLAVGYMEIQDEDEEEMNRGYTRLGKALEDGRRLVNRWKKVPCGDSSPEPPPSAPISIQNQLASNHPNGFGNPPSFECNRAKVTPAQQGIEVIDQISRPDGTTVTKHGLTDPNGVATFSAEINQTGDYVHTTTANVNGQAVSDTDTNTVTAQDNGTCPPATP